MSECGLILKLAGLFVQASQGTNQLRDVIQTPSIATPSLPPVDADHHRQAAVASYVFRRGRKRRNPALDTLVRQIESEISRYGGLALAS
jgi:hypothetical protein